ncbi:MAG TPA: hypothetical protein VJW93_05520 [Candidatus Acidoferrales bacterium]|nr:hypothetical protein [Candidatus Acidoferrales bacterium]
MRTSRFQIIAAVVLLLIALSAASRAQIQKSPSQEERTKAVSLVRLINTAEITYASGSKDGSVGAHGVFGSWDELNKSGAVKAVQSRWPEAKNLSISDGNEIMPGWHLDLLVSSDGKSWSVALHDTRDGDGLFSVFSDSSGIIYLGAPMQ